MIQKRYNANDNSAKQLEASVEKLHQYNQKEKGCFYLKYVVLLNCSIIRGLREKPDNFIIPILHLLRISNSPSAHHQSFLIREDETVSLNVASLAFS